MARPLRVVLPDGVYHVTVRGNARQAIFWEECDRPLLLEVLGHVVTRFGWLCHAYCLMGNHYHLLIETPLPNLPSGMRQLNGVYAQRFNRRHKRVGHLFQGRYGAILVESEQHLLEVARYIVLNPVRAGIVTRPADWPWSSYRATAGLAERPPFLTVSALLEHFSDTPHPRLAYQRFVAAGVTADPPQPIGDLYLGSPDFAHAHAPNTRIDEIPRRQWNPIVPSLEDVYARHGENATLVAYHQYGYTLKQIADHLGLHYSTISRQLRAHEPNPLR